MLLLSNFDFYLWFLRQPYEGIWCLTFNQISFPVGASQEYNLSVLYCNRATSRHKMGNCSGSIEDCNSALELQPTSIKALARRAMAYETTEK
jgi:hypothetical protein